MLAAGCTLATSLRSAAGSRPAACFSPAGFATEACTARHLQKISSAICLKPRQQTVVAHMVMASDLNLAAAVPPNCMFAAGSSLAAVSALGACSET
jgi:hypothetical protein